LLSQQLANPPHNRFPIGVQVFEPADIHRLNAALGWLGLDSPDDARLELDGIAANQQSHPAVLEARWLLCAREKNWCEALVVARRELAEAPKLASGWLHQAYALELFNKNCSHLQGALVGFWHANEFTGSAGTNPGFLRQ